MLYMATGKPAHLGCKFLSDVSVVNSPIVVELLVITVLFCVVLPASASSTQLLHLVGLISLLYPKSDTVLRHCYLSPIITGENLKISKER